MSKERILVIEDEEDILALVHYNMVKAGYRVEVATCGEEGLYQAEATRPDLIVLDLMLPILESALQSCATVAETRKIQFRLFCSEQLAAHVKAPLLEQAIINLVDNAVKYSEPGGVVTVEGWQDGEQVMIKVKDRGQGIPKEHLPRLFERFYRVDGARSRTAGGTGLGLAIVKHIVQAHNGEVKVHSTPGEGSVFTIILPIV